MDGSSLDRWVQVPGERYPVRRILGVWCPECFYRLGRALLVWLVIGGLVARRARRRSRS